MQKLFLICPVRGCDPKETEAIVAALEATGYIVHWPPRDTNQDDANGILICARNRDAIESADVVGIVWNGTSEGCLFDAGIAWAMRKPLMVISLPQDKTDGKSFVKMFIAWGQTTTTWPRPVFAE